MPGGVGRRTLALLAALSLLLPLRPAFASSGGTGSGAGRHGDTNVIFISVDTLRSDHLGCYGYGKGTSPNIDALAGKSVLFENFIGHAILTPVSQMSIFTSQYPRVNGMTSFAVREEDVTERRLPQILKLYGYTNAAFLSSREFTLQFKALSGRSIRTRNLFSKSFDVYEEALKYEEIPKAMEWIRNNRDRKFFLWISASTVHWPYGQGIPEPHLSKFDGPGPGAAFARVLEGKTLHRGGFGRITYSEILSRLYRDRYYVDFAPQVRLSQRDVDFIRARYDAGIFHTDLFVGRLLSLLDELDLADRTLVVFHSIHGEDLGEHGYFNHYDLYDTEVKNALVMKFPGSRQGGKRVSPQVQAVDVMPTVLDWLGIPVNHEAMGVSLVPLIERDDAAQVSEFAYSARIPLWEVAVAIVHSSRATRLFFRPDTDLEREEHGRYMDMLLEYVRSLTGDPPHDTAIRTKDWKLLLRKDTGLLERISWWRFISGEDIAFEEVELYDLREDPMEQHDVASRYPEVTSRLREKLMEWNSLVESRRPKGGGGGRSLIPYP